MVGSVAADPARLPVAAMAGGEGAWRYWRWQGSPRVYYSQYGDQELATLAATLRAARRNGSDCWCVFDNTAGGHAMRDAARLQLLVQSHRASR